MMLSYELKRTFRSFFNFTLGMLATWVIFIGFFDLFREDAALMDQLLQNFPAEFKAAFGFSDVNLSEIEGYLSFLISYINLIGAVFAMKLGVGLLSAEPREKTADFLLSKPVRRRDIVTAKLMTALIQLTAQILLLYAVSIATIAWLLDVRADQSILAQLIVSILLVQLFFLGLGFALAAAAKRIKAVMPITLGIVFFFFIVEMINESLHLEKLTYLTPFAYFKGSELLKTGSLSWPYIMLDLAVFAAAITGSYFLYQRKDFHAV